MIGLEDAAHTFEYCDYYKILPAIHDWSSDPLRIKKGIKVPADFQYISNKNSEWMTTETLAQWIQDNYNTLK